MGETVCGSNLKPMADWVKEKGESCRPCVIPVTMEWYHSELKERHEDALAAQVEAAQDSEDIEVVGRVLDEIKAKASPELRDRLLEFDCATQQLKPEDLQEPPSGDASPLDSPAS